LDATDDVAGFVPELLLFVIRRAILDTPCRPNPLLALSVWLLDSMEMDG
jgi:hypothetical protein